MSMQRNMPPVEGRILYLESAGYMNKLFLSCFHNTVVSTIQLMKIKEPGYEMISLRVQNLETLFMYYRPACWPFRLTTGQ